MCAFNQILFGFGIESIEGEWQNGYWCNILLTYVNMGFSDLPTIIHHRDKGFIVDSIENIITKSNRRAWCQNKSPRKCVLLIRFSLDSELNLLKENGKTAIGAIFYLPCLLYTSDAADEEDSVDL